MPIHKASPLRPAPYRKTAFTAGLLADQLGVDRRDDLVERHHLRLEGHRPVGETHQPQPGASSRFRFGTQLAQHVQRSSREPPGSTDQSMSPPRNTRPESNRSKVMNMRKRIDSPDSLGPIEVTFSPVATAKSKFWRTTVGSKLFHTLLRPSLRMDRSIDRPTSAAAGRLPAAGPPS